MIDLTVCMPLWVPVLILAALAVITSFEFAWLYRRDLANRAKE